MKYHFKADNHTQACMVLLLNGFGSTNLILICSWLLICINGALAGVIAGVAVDYTVIEQRPIEGPAHCLIIVAFFLLNVRKFKNSEK